MDEPNLLPRADVAVDEPIPLEDSLYNGAIRTLRVGFLTAAALFVAGVVWSLATKNPVSTTVLAVQDLPSELADGNPAALLDLSILVLMATPIVTVLFIAINFYRLGERRFALVSLLVLVILTMSIVIASTK